MTENSLANTNKQQTGMLRVKNYIMSPEVKDRFSEMMGARGIYYLNQVLTQVANSNDLQNCDPKSILIAAMQAAGLRLSVDPTQGHAWIIPYKGTATFQLGYKGVYELALRTNQYRFINVIDVFEGEVIEEDRMTGIHSISGKRTSDRVVARMLYFKLFSGYEKTFVMTVEEIEAHAKHYSKAYNSAKSKWNDPHERPKMERKTVLMNGLRRWGRFNEDDSAYLDQVEGEEYGRFSDLPDEDQVSVVVSIPPRKESAILGDLGIVVEGTESDDPQSATPVDTELEAAKAIKIGSKTLGEYTVDELMLISENKKASEGLRKAADLIIGRMQQPAII